MKPASVELRHTGLTYIIGYYNPLLDVFRTARVSSDVDRSMLMDLVDYSTGLINYNYNFSGATHIVQTIAEALSKY